MFYKVVFGLLLFLSSLFANLNFKDINNFKADFIHTIKNETGKVVKYEGKIYIKDKNRVLWQYLTPIKKNVYVLDKQVIIDEPELEQVIYTALEKNVDITKLLQDAKKVSENLYKTKLFDIEYFIETQNGQIKKIRYTDELLNKVEIIFSNISTKDSIDSSIFNFIPPSSYDIVEKY